MNLNWQTIGRIFKLGTVNFWRNRWLSLAATLIMTVTLLIISTFTILTLVINKTTESIRNKMDISVNFTDAVSIEKIIDMQKKLAGRNDVKEVRYISKEEALTEFKKNNPELVTEEVETENPIYRSLEIKASKAEDLDEISSFIKGNEFKQIVYHVKEEKVIIDRLIGITNFLKKGGIISSIAFVLISILVILNTIKLTIFTRKDEIEIMRLVGASDNFIKVPFIVEALLYALLATVLSVFVIKMAIIAFSPMIQQNLGDNMVDKMNLFFAENFLVILGLELLVGIVISASCSLISIRKHLRV